MRSVLWVLLVLLAGCSDKLTVFRGAEPSVPEVKKTTADTSRPAIEVIRAEAHQPAIRVNFSEDPDNALVEMQGYVEAQDRFFQMDLLRRQTQGELSEIFGEQTLERDLQAHGAGLVESIKLTTELIQNEYPNAYTALEFFAKGVNRYLSELERQRPELLKLYRYYVGDRHYLPREWVPKDSIAIAKGISFHLSSGLNAKLMMTSVVASVLKNVNDPNADPDKILEKFKEILNYFDLRPVENEFIMGELSPWTKKHPDGWKVPEGERNKSPEHLLSLRDWPVFGCLFEGFPFPACKNSGSVGSNNFVVGPAFSSDGASYLENDPHLDLTFPSTFYEVALDSTPAGGHTKMRGLNLPGIPGVLIGHNRDIAWGFTNLGADVDDLYLDAVDEKSNKFEFKGKMLDIRETPEVIQVRQRDGSLREHRFRYRVVGPHGPILSDVLPAAIKDALKKIPFKPDREPALSYRWTGHGATTEVPAIFQMTMAKNFTEFKEALQLFQTGAQNIVYADKEGNIGYFAHGKFPIRNYLSVTELYPIPYTPVFGLGEQEWEGFRESVPELYNPPWGKIVTANNDPYGHSENPYNSNYEDYFGIGFSTGSRAKRISELLDQNKGRVDRKVVAAIQMDHKDMGAMRFGEILKEAQSIHSLKQGLSDRAGQLLSTITAWEEYGYVAGQGLKQPVQFYEWFYSMADLHFASLKADLPEDIFRLVREDTVAFKTLYHKVRDGLANPATLEGTVRLLRNSLDVAAQALHSRNALESPWGEKNQLQFKNLLPGILPTAFLFPVPRDGAWDTVDVAANGKGPNFRLVMRIEKSSIEAWNALPGGNIPSSQTDGVVREINRWRFGEHRPLVPFVE